MFAIDVSDANPVTWCNFNLIIGPEGISNVDKLPVYVIVIVACPEA
jgi:hypothetical protein